MLYPEFNFGPEVLIDETKMKIYEVLESEFISSSQNT